MNHLKLQQLLEQFFIEDMGDQDVSSNLLFNNGQHGKVVFLAKEPGVFCGKDIIKTGFHLMDPKIEVEVRIQDGTSVEKGMVIAEAFGEVKYLLSAERVILNLIQRMSGIATKTKQAVDLLNSNHTRICDTRKTTPGLRMLEKYAVRCGGGFNHRLGLYDAIMLKDNHISFAGSITNALKTARSQVGHMVKIEVETETEEQVREAVEANVDVIMFDNRTPDEIKKFIKLVPSHIVTEASGGITLETLGDYSMTGVDYISLGFLTHSVKALDISVKVFF
ncbi:carboxylating nicotinate-nucleotide diphosphorylase [Bacillaceae bacterium S4-13-56]